MESNDVGHWWDKFLKSNRAAALASGLLSDDRNTVFLFAQYERESPVPVVRGTADLSRDRRPEVRRVIAPLITTQAESEDFARNENIFTEGAYSYVRNEAELIPILFRQQSGAGAVGAGETETYYDGLWFCIQTDDLQDGDKIEFGATGVRDFQAKAVWRVKTR